MEQIISGDKAKMPMTERFYSVNGQMMGYEHRNRSSPNTSPPLHHLKSLSGHGSSEGKSENLTGHYSSDRIHERSRISEPTNPYDRKLPARSSYRSRSRTGRSRLKIPGISGDTTPSPDAFKSLKLFTRRASFSISTCSIM
jgi:hypothetical protein